MRIPQYIDLADMEEDNRIRLIAKYVNAGQTVAFVVDTGSGYEGKGDRYINKLLVLVPFLKIDYRGAGPVANTETIRVKK